MSDKEILKLLEISTNRDSNQELTKVPLAMPKILLDDEVKKPIKTIKKEQMSDKPKEKSTFNLESIFTKEFLAHIKVEDLEKPLKDIILTNYQEDLKLDWTYYEEHKDYICEVKFESKELLDIFLVNSFEYIDSLYKLESPLTIEVYVSQDHKDNLDALNTIYANTVKKKDDVKKVELDQSKAYYKLQIPLSYTGEIVQKFENGKDYFVKVPVAKIGKWKHPVYKEVSFTEEDLDNILINFENNELGFEPPIYFGHSTDGTPAQGFLVKLERSGDILFGYWRVNKEAYRLVEDEVYRYSSAEIILDLTSKATGEGIGKAVYGMALTNIPFVPDLPKVQALEDAIINNDVVFLSFTNNDNTKINNKEEEKMSEGKEMTSVELALKEQVETYAAKVKELELTRQELEQSSKFKELKEQIEMYSQKETEYKETAQKLSVVVEQNKQLADKLEEYEQNIRAKEVDSKVSKLDSLPLPTDFKQVYSNLIKENKLGEVESIILSSLESLASSYTNQLLEQSGTNEETSNLNNQEFIDPYQAEIERCKRLIEQRIN